MSVADLNRNLSFFNFPIEKKILISKQVEAKIDRSPFFSKIRKRSFIGKLNFDPFPSIFTFRFGSLREKADADADVVAADEAYRGLSPATFARHDVWSKTPV